MIQFAPYISIYGLEKLDFLNDVIWTFSKNLTGVGTQRQRFNIHIVTEESYQRKSLDSSIKSIWKYFDKSQLSKTDLTLNKKMILELIKDSFIDVSNDLNWDENQIMKAYQLCISDNIEFKYTTKPKANRQRSAKGIIKLELEDDKVAIWGILTDYKNNEIKKVLMLETFLSQVSWLKTFKRMKWVNEKEFGFEFNNGITLSISPNEDKPFWRHKDTENENGFIRSVTYKTFNSDQEKIDWMNK